MCDPPAGQRDPPPRATKAIHWLGLRHSLGRPGIGEPGQLEKKGANITVTRRGAPAIKRQEIDKMKMMASR